MIKVKLIVCVFCKCLLVIALATAGCTTEQNTTSTRSLSNELSTTAEYVGGQQCSNCHEEEWDLWQGSHHELSFQSASSNSILGNFSDVSFDYNGNETLFFMKDESYWVRTDGPEGDQTEYKVTHTIGIEPLQQYVVEFPNGHYQVLSTAWDTRHINEGGQRWFHLYPDNAINHENPLHWTGIYQNWNSSCADCHSTNLKKNYLPNDGSFHTEYSDVNVSCEACHGPGSLHAEQPERFPLILNANSQSNWSFRNGNDIAERTPTLDKHNEIQICARCHSRRSQLSDSYDPGDPFLDAFRPSLLDYGIYHPDGQIQEEVYVYGSFLQSKMYAAGVTCSDCHEPHSGTLRFEGDSLCTQCHLVTTYADQSHNHHDGQSEEINCVNCHMPEQTYMIVDPRRDHSFRVPRPDLSISIGTPNACNNCHNNETSQWAVNQISEWFPQNRLGTPHYGDAIHAGQIWSEERNPLLVSLVNDQSLPAIVRATGIKILSNQLDNSAINIISRLLQSEEPLIQLEGLAALQSVDLETRVNLGQRFLSSPLKALRIEAAKLLLPARFQLSNRRRADLDLALEEHWDSLNFNSERGEGLLGRANTLMQIGDLEGAETILLEAIDKQAYLTAAYINLADIYRQTGREEEAINLLQSGTINDPQNPAGFLALGMSYVRSGQTEDAIEMLNNAAALAPNDPYYQYVAGIAINSTNDTQSALAKLVEAHNQFPGHRDILFALAAIYRDQANWDLAELYTQRLLSISPSDEQAQILLEEIERASAP